MRTVFAAFFAVATLLTAQVLALAGMGRPWVCPCGFVALWHGTVDAQNSQHITDWYTLSHVGHGIVFAILTTLLIRHFQVARQIPLAVWAVGWLAIEVVWEVFENTPHIISLYRTDPVSRAYAGDSIINSLGDSIAMLLGFVVTLQGGAMVGALLLFLLEGVALWAVGDALVRNVWFFLTQVVRAVM